MDGYTVLAGALIFFGLFIYLTWFGTSIKMESQKEEDANIKINPYDNLPLHRKLIDKKNNTACVVDPGEADPIIEYLENNNIKLKFILNTHHHYDHVGGNEKLKEKYGASIIGYKGDKERIPKIDILVNDQETWIYGNFEAKVIHVTGHTLGWAVMAVSNFPLKSSTPMVSKSLFTLQGKDVSSKASNFPA